MNLSDVLLAYLLTVCVYVLNWVMCIWHSEDACFFVWTFLGSLYRFPCIKFHSLKLILFVMQMNCDVEHHWTPQSFSRHFCVIFAKIPHEKSNDCSKLVRGLRVDYFHVGSLWQRCLRFPWSLVWSWTQSLPLQRTSGYWFYVCFRQQQAYGKVYNGSVYDNVSHTSVNAVSF